MSQRVELSGDPLRVVAVEITHRVGDVSRTIRYELEGGEPVEICYVGGAICILSKSNADVGR